jgi:hypothetical protein
MIAHYDDSELVIRDSWKNRRKRKQGRSVPPPALLAMAGSFLGADLEAFEMARQAYPPHLLEIDEERIGVVVELFKRYSDGDMSFAKLGSLFGLAEARVREILANPVFNGWVVRGSRGRRRPEERVAARWRDNPPVDDELWERVCAVRQQRKHGGGPRRRDRRDPLGGLVYCTCGRYLKANGLDGGGRHQRIHLGACAAWAGRQTYPTETWYRPMVAQVSQIQLDNATIERVVRALAAPVPTQDQLRRKRLEAQRRQLAADYAIGKLREPEFLSAVAMTRDQEAEVPRAPRALDARSVVRRLRGFTALWASRSEAQQAEMLRTVYARVEVEGAKFVRAHLTPDAQELGLTLALPESFAMARPAGFEPAT